MTAWMDDAKCAGVKDFTEWPRESQAVLCEACPVAKECAQWMAEPIPTAAGRGPTCRRGHVYLEVGRAAGGRCRACRREASRRVRGARAAA